MLEHTQLFDELLTGIKPLDFMKKHYKAYVSGFAGAAELRAELMLAEGYEQIAQIVEN